MWKHAVFAITVLVYCTSSQNISSCVCVPYFQCRSNGTVITDGEGLLDERMGTCSSCNCTDPLEICCSLPNAQGALTKTVYSLGTCGYSNPDGLFKIGGQGEETLFGEFPWMIKIFEDGSYRCGGSLIHPSVVLTAAHCVKSRTSTYTARAGEWDRRNTDEILKHQERKAKFIKMHEKFDNQTFINDIALIFLEQPFDLKIHINVTCLAPANYVVGTSRCVATGWGNTLYAANQNGSNILKKVELPVVSHSTCQKALRTTRLGEYYRLHSSFVCAGGEKDVDTCTGDGGGPLFCPFEEDENRYVQVGVVSWGIDCNNESVPGVYANVAYLRKWVDKQMKSRNLDTTSYTY